MTQEQNQDQNQTMTLEEAFETLDALAEQLENKDISLEVSFQVYQKGMELLKQCSEKIDTVEKKMLQVNADGQLTEF
ncbi:MAG: exodeoxyribonuclease VII small subunit [Eubacterium sp.]|nr:exodeoxyribonuclease VII small subunit [Eubacterium sp.]